jgi:hypothetical protein
VTVLDCPLLTLHLTLTLIQLLLTVPLSVLALTSDSGKINLVNECVITRTDFVIA